jgi:hypothetical protein
MKGFAKTALIVGLGTAVSWAVGKIAPWGSMTSFVFGGICMFIFLMREIMRLEDAVTDLERDQIVRNEEVFTDAQWREINRRFVLLRDRIDERIPPKEGEEI